MKSNNFFTYNKHLLEYKVFGTGNKVLICFHGFGKNLSDFENLSKKLINYKVYSFNLFHHGESQLNKELKLTKNELNDVFEAFLKKENISELSILGYSIGARIALCLTERISASVKQLILLAPDGIRMHPLYVFASKNKIGREIYRKIINNPKLSLSVVNKLYSYKIINRRLKHFAEYYLKDNQKLKLSYKTWKDFRYLIPSKKSLIKRINSNNINVLMFYGKFDAVIPHKHGKQFLSKISQEENFNLLSYGHKLMIDEVFELVAKKLN